MTCHDCQERIVGRGYPIYRSQAKRCDRCHEDDIRRSMREEQHFGPIKPLRRKQKDEKSIAWENNR